jgi:hypothetical protein
MALASVPILGFTPSTVRRATIRLEWGLCARTRFIVDHESFDHCVDCTVTDLDPYRTSSVSFDHLVGAGAGSPRVDPDQGTAPPCMRFIT